MCVGVKTNLHVIFPREELFLEPLLERKSKSAPEGGDNVNNRQRFESFLKELCVNFPLLLLVESLRTLR